MIKSAIKLSQSVFNEFDEPVLVFNINKKLVFFNRAAQKLLGKNCRLKTGVDFSKLFDFKSGQGSNNYTFDLAAMARNEKLTLKVSGSIPELSAKELRISTFAIRCDDAGSQRDFLFIIKKKGTEAEIAALHKMAVKDLKASEERYRTVADFTYDWEYWISPEGKMIYVSPSCERISGRTPEEFINDPGLFFDIIHPADRKKTIVHMQNSSKRSRVLEIIFRIISSDKEIKWVHHISQPVFDIDGNPLGRRASNRDITERKIMENKISENEERYRTVADFTYDWEYWISPEGCMRYVSPSCERISGYSRKEFVNDPSLFEKIMHPADRKRTICLMTNASEKSKVCETDFRIIRRDEDIRWIHHISQPVYSKNGNYLGRRASNRDITSRKKIDRELEESRKKLIEQNIELERKNIALKEVLGRIELEKKEVQDNVMLNVENVLLPILNELASASSGREKNNIELIKKNISELTSAFGSRITVKSLKLTPKEIRICNMIKNGMNNKDIANTLNISLRTAETHRNNIRKKLSITNASVNLVTYLQNYFSL